MELNLKIRSPGRSPPTGRTNLNSFLDEQRLTKERLKTIDEKLKKYREDWGIKDSDDEEEGEEEYRQEPKDKKRDGWILNGIDNRNLAILLDTSRDMIDNLKEIGTQLLRFLAKKSKPFKFNIIGFSGDLDPFVDAPIECTRQSLELTKAWLEGTIRTLRMSSARSEARNTLEALAFALGEDEYDAAVLITSGLPEQKSSTVVRCAEQMSKNRPVHIVYVNNNNKQPFSTGAFLYSIAQKTNGIFRKLDMNSDGPTEDRNKISYDSKRSRNRLSDDTARSCEMYNNFINDSIDNMSLQDDCGYKKKDYGDHRKYEARKFPSVAESTVSSIHDEPSLNLGDDVESRHVEDAKNSLLRLKLRVGHRPNVQTSVEVENVNTSYRFPVALTLMKGRSVLARRPDGFHHLGVIADVVSDYCFTVLFDETGRSSPEEVDITEVISYDDAIRHPIAVGDSVLAPRLSDDHFSRATVVKQGDTVTVKFEDGSFEILPRDSVIWFSASQDPSPPLPPSSFKSTSKPMYAKSDKKSLSSGSGSDSHDDKYIKYLEKQRKKKLKKSGGKEQEKTQDDRLQQLQEENDSLKKKLDDTVEVREARPIKSPGSRRRRNPYDDPSLSYDSGLASEGEYPSRIQPGRPYHGADSVWRRSLSAKEFASSQPKVRVASVPVDEIWGQGRALHEWHHDGPDRKYRIAAPIERTQRPQSASAIHVPHPPGRSKHRKSRTCTDTKPIHSKKWQDTYQVNYGGGGRKILPDTSLYRSQKKEVRFTHDPNRPKHVEYHTADGVPFPRKTDRQFYAKPATWGPGTEDYHPYRHHDIIAHRTVDFPDTQPAVETQYRAGGNPAYRVNASAKKTQVSNKNTNDQEEPRNLRNSHENDTHDKIRITIESEGKKLKYKSQAKENHSNFEYDREHANQVHKYDRTDALRERNKGYHDAETAREQGYSSAADHKEALRRVHDSQRNEEQRKKDANSTEDRNERKQKHLQKTRARTDARFNALRNSRDQNRDMNGFVDGHAYDRSRSYVLP